MNKKRCPIGKLNKFWKKMAYRTTYKTPLGMFSYKLVYGKNFHLPIELEKKAYWAIKELKLDPELAKEERLFQLQKLEEF
ncbi:KRAB-A domain-containing protein 2-like [Gossypium australe]|uniref:KRAB-A domain-containing protein 2-like n=1 Tax=Gossypium australe TaxID=47621 RepID=A0A5B6WPL4_9ROSI|nr:KRAB-A domain-containing protein 2-like [Gossypium australe]